MKTFNEKLFETMSSLLADAWPAVDAMSIYPVNISSSDANPMGEISSVLKLIDYLDPHFKDILLYLSSDDLVFDLRNSFRHSLHVFE